MTDDSNFVRDGYVLQDNFSIATEKFKCDNGHEGEIRTSVWCNGRKVANFCGICYAEWAEKQWPVTKV